MSPYATVLVCGLAVCFLLYALRVRTDKLSFRAFGLSLPLILVFCIIFSKLVYALCFLDFSYVDEYWFEITFLGLSPSEFSVIGGAAGACLAVVLAAKAVHASPAPLLDAFAPCGAVFLAFVRFSEMYQGRLGAGPLLEGTSILSRFPLAIQNDYGEWFLSVFLMEAAAALAVAVVFWSVPLRHAGLRAELTAVYLALPQIFFESLRSICMRWGFVRCEQVFCGVILLVLVVSNGARTKGGMKRFLPALGIICAIGVIVFVEFALDKFNIPHLVSYGLMILSLVAMALFEHRSIYNLHTGA